MLSTFESQEITIKQVSFAPTRFNNSLYPVLSILVGAGVFMGIGFLLRFIPSSLMANGFFSILMVVVCLAAAVGAGTWFYQWRKRTMDEAYRQWEKTFASAVTVGLAEQGYDIRHASQHLEGRILEHESGQFYRVHFDFWEDENTLTLHVTPYFG